MRGGQSRHPAIQRQDQCGPVGVFVGVFLVPGGFDHLALPIGDPAHRPSAEDVVLRELERPRDMFDAAGGPAGLGLEVGQAAAQARPVVGIVAGAGA